jgi:uncharacterized membrane protein
MKNELFWFLVSVIAVIVVLVAAYFIHKFYIATAPRTISVPVLTI